MEKRLNPVEDKAIDPYRLFTSRRNFLKEAGCLGGLAILSGALPFVGVREWNARAEISAMAIISIMSTAANMMGLFSQPRNGLSAMLQAQLKYLEIIVTQLNSINKSLATIIEQIANIKEETRELLAWQYQKELTVELIAASQNYSSLLRAGKRDTNIWKHAEVQAQIRHILKTVKDRRARLSLIDEGNGPETALIAPVACALEVAAEGRLGLPDDVTIQTLKDYNAWFDEILGGHPRSIPVYLREAVDEHEAIIDAAVNTRLGKAMEIGKFRLAENQETPEGIESCIHFAGDMLGTMITEPGVIKNYSKNTNLTYEQMFEMILSPNLGIFTQYGQIEIHNDESIGIRSLIYNRGALKRGYRKQTDVGNPPRMKVTAEGEFPPKNTGCYIERCPNSRKMHKEQVSDCAKESIQVKFATSEHDELIGTLADINLQRMRMSFGLRSISILENTKRRVNEYLSSIK